MEVFDDVDAGVNARSSGGEFAFKQQASNVKQPLE
jgi:hypothetical protein